ncbi:MAG: hypothetical protein M1434_04500 [Chloroflexi bacterium]|nr:hypothetical protein [Chloroflexota bacterium]MCL5273994.1 hypothetical protein [Chloroflexota bacterium]
MEKILRALSAGIILIAAVIAFVISTRIDQNTISVLSGTIIGVLIAIPCGALLTIVLLRRREGATMTTYERQMRCISPLPQNPPQYWVLPPQLSGMANTSMMRNGASPAISAPAAWQMPQDSSGAPPPRRKFYVIGENGEPRAVDQDEMDTASSGDPYAYNGGETGAAF